MGMWGTNDKNIKEAKEYCASFYCSLAQLDLEMLLDGTLDDLDGVIMTVLCDTLRPMSQNIRVAMDKLGKMPTIFLAHPQNRRPEYGIQYTISQYNNVKEQLEEIAGKKITDEALKEAIKVYNRSREERRRFVKLAGEHPEAVSAVNRSAVHQTALYDQMTARLNHALGKGSADQRKSCTDGNDHIRFNGFRNGIGLHFLFGVLCVI